MPVTKNLCRAATPRFINSHGEFIVAQVLDLPLEIVWKKNRRPQVVQARSLFCYWASKKLGMSMTEIANRLGLTQPAVSIAARRGEEIATKCGYSLFDE
jgi:putative transposase